MYHDPHDIHYKLLAYSSSNIIITVVTTSKCIASCDPIIMPICGNDKLLIRVSP